jgi:hypothetical protein
MAALPLPPSVAADLDTIVQDHIQALVPSPMSVYTTQQRAQVALLCAQDLLTYKQIARSTRITDPETITAWLKHPDYAAVVHALRTTLAQHALHTGLADALTRLRARDQRWRRLHAIIEQRQDHYTLDPSDPNYDNIPPGADSGLLVKDTKVLEDGSLINTYRVDAPLLRELRELESETAKELGQLAPDRSLHINVTTTLDASLLDPSDLAELRNRISGRSSLAALLPPISTPDASDPPLTTAPPTTHHDPD